MSSLLRLPTEVLVHIFKGMDCIDDLNYLRRTCRRFASILESTGESGSQENSEEATLYATIVRTVIVNSHIHRYDFQICRLIEVHQSIVQYQCKSDNQDPIRSRGNIHMSLKKSLFAHPEALTDTQIHEIVARWESIKQLENIYLSQKSGLGEVSYLNPWSLEKRPSVYVERLRDLLPTKQESQTRRSCRYRPHGFNREQRIRFYLAITCWWFMNEYRWCFSHVKFNPQERNGGWMAMVKSFDMRMKMDEKIYGKRKLIDELDLLEVYEFLAHHLLPKHSGIFESIQNDHILWGQSRMSMREDHVSDTQALLSAAMMVLQPPDIMEAIAWSKTRTEKDDYSDPWQPSFLNWVDPNKKVFMADLYGASLSSRPRAYQSVPFPGDVHYLYLLQRIHSAILKTPELSLPEAYKSVHFEKHWELNIRGNVFWWAQSESKAAAKLNRWIISFKNGPKCPICAGPEHGRRAAGTVS